MVHHRAAPQPTFPIEYGTDTSRTIASLVFSGAAHTYPDIRWIFSHAGGTMPFLVERYLLQGRLLKNNSKAMEKIPNGVMYELQRMRFETAQAANPYALGPFDTAGSENTDLLRHRLASSGHRRQY